MEFKKREPKNIAASVDVQQKLLNWPESYYRERDPKIRLAMLEEAVRQNLTPDENELRRKIFDLRYGKLTKDGREQIDKYIKTWIEMRFLAQNDHSGIFSKGPNPKRVRKLFQEIGYYDAKSQAEKNLYYQEFYHMALLYMALCQEDKQFNTVVLGFGRISEDTQARKIGQEFATVARQVPEKFGVEEELEIFTKAVLTAYLDMYPDFADVLD